MTRATFSPREYYGCQIHALGPNSWGGRYGAYTPGGYVKADTLAGIRDLIRNATKARRWTS